MEVQTTTVTELEARSVTELQEMKMIFALER